MPEGIKTQLISLGLWSMRYSTLATLKDLPITPLLDVNRNIVSGLAAQVPTPTAAPRKRSPVIKPRRLPSPPDAPLVRRAAAPQAVPVPSAAFTGLPAKAARR